VSTAAAAGRNRIMSYGPKRDGTYVIEFKTAAGEALAISIPQSGGDSALPGAHALPIVRTEPRC
jgi:hypothetical protein